MTIKNAQASEVLRKTASLLAKQNVMVTQQGSRAFIRWNALTGDIQNINLPVVPTDAPEDFLTVLNGYLDHEVGHALNTDPTKGRAIEDAFIDANGGKRIESVVRGFVNIVEDVRIEAAQEREFRGSKKNLDRVRRYLFDKITGPVINNPNESDEKKRAYAIVPYFRARGGQLVARNFMDDNNLWPMFEDIDAAFPDLENKLAALTSTSDAANLACEILSKISSPPPPPQEGDEGDDEAEDSDNGGQEGEGDKKSQDKPDQPDQQPEDDEGDEESEGQEDEDGEDQAEGGSDSEGEGAEGDEEDEAEEGDDEGDDEGSSGSAGDDEDDAEEDGDGDESEGGGSGSEGDPEEDGDDSDASDEGDGEDDTGNAGSDDGEPDEDTDTEGDDDTEGTGDAGEQGEDEDEGEGDGGEGDTPDTGQEFYDEDEELGEESGEHDVGGVGGSELDLDQLGLDGDDLEDFDEQMAKELEIHVSQMDTNDSYRVFTRDWDKIELYPHDPGVDIEKYERNVAKTSAALRKEIERLVAARSLATRVPGQRRGRIHAASLHRLMVNDDRVFTKKHEATSRDTAISLLIDCSGSMMGYEKLKVAIESAWAFSDVLSRIKINHEILGFTTHYSIPSKVPGPHGDVSTGQAMRQFKDINPGHVRFRPIHMPILKPFGENFDTEAKKRMVTLTKGYDCCENIDGESVMIAAQRLSMQPQQRKVLIVFSDGMPAGDVMPAVLARDLKKTVAEIDKSGIETVGISIMDNAAERFYPRSFTIKESAELTGTMLGELKRVLLG